MQHVESIQVGYTARTLVELSEYNRVERSLINQDDAKATQFFSMHFLYISFTLDQ
jgi:hypothetical protein